MLLIMATTTITLIAMTLIMMQASINASIVMQMMQTQMRETFEQVGQAIFVCKFLNATHMNLD